MWNRTYGITLIEAVLIRVGAASRVECKARLFR